MPSRQSSPCAGCGASIQGRPGSVCIDCAVGEPPQPVSMGVSVGASEPCYLCDGRGWYDTFSLEDSTPMRMVCDCPLVPQEPPEPVSVADMSGSTMEDATHWGEAAIITGIPEGRVYCPACDGTGDAPTMRAPCELCNGSGAVVPAPPTPQAGPRMTSWERLMAEEP